MQKDRINILYLEDDEKQWETFQERVASYNDLNIKRVATSTECIKQFNETKWDGFIFDAMGIVKKNDKPRMSVLAGVEGEFRKLKIRKPYVIYTAHMDGGENDILELMPHLSRDLIFKKTDTEEMLKHIIDDVKGKAEYKFRITNTEMFQVLNSKEFFDLKAGYIKLYDKIGKDAPSGMEIKNEMNTIRRIFERIISQIGKIYSENGEDDVKLEPDLEKKVKWLCGSKRPKYNENLKKKIWIADDRIIDTPEIVGTTMNTIRIMTGVNIHDYEGTTKRTLDGLLYLMGDLLYWYYNAVLTNSKLYDSEVN